MENGQGFLPGAHVIEGMGAGGFRFGGMSHRGSLLALPVGMYAFAPLALEAIDEASLAPLFAMPAGHVDLLLLGCGLTLRPTPQWLREKLSPLAIRCEPMSTSAACQTYNILMEEKRRVAAVLIATE